MPELPEVETVIRTLAPQVLGCGILGAKLYNERTLAAGRDWLDRLEGARISAAWRRAKLAVLELSLPGKGEEEEPLLAVFHLKMTGRLFVHPLDFEPHKHTKLTFDLSAPGAAGGEPDRRLFFDDMRGFGYCRLARQEELPDWKFWAELGPEPLLSKPKALAKRFAGRRGRVKALLLDQSVIVGIGNIYADEALFRAGIRPDALTQNIEVKKLEKLCSEVQSILKEAIAQCGSSIRDYRDANGNAGAFQNSFNVYGRKGEDCKTCGQPLEATRVAGRGTVFCPHCQE